MDTEEQSDPAVDSGGAEDVNYLILLPPRVFIHLSRFSSSQVMHEVVKAYSLSISHHQGQPEGVNEGSAEFHLCVSDHVVWECAKFKTYIKEESGGYSVTALAGKDMENLSKFKRYIQHLCIETNLYLIDGNLFEFLIQQLLPNNGTLKSVDVFLQEDKHCNQNIFDHDFNNCAYHQRFSWPLFSREVKKQETVKVTMRMKHLSFGKQSLDRNCRLLSLPAESLLCQHLTFLHLSVIFSGENQMFEHKPDLTEFPTRSFMAKLSALQHLGIGVYNANVSLLDFLVKRAGNKTIPLLRSLTIHMNLMLEHTGVHGSLSEVSEKTWQDLAEAYPDLQLTCIIVRFRAESLLEKGKKERIAINVASAEAGGGKIDQPVKQGFGATLKMGSLGVLPHDDYRLGEASFFDIHVSKYPLKAAQALVTFFKSSAPLTNLILWFLDEEDSNYVVNNCGLFWRSLKYVAFFPVFGEWLTIFPEDLMSPLFSMRHVQGLCQRFQGCQLDGVEFL